MQSESKNPYQPPQAVLDQSITAIPGRRLWKVYFWFLFAVLLLGYPILFSEGSPQVLDIVDIVPTITGLVGLFAFAYTRKVGQRQFWSLFLPLIIVYDLVLDFILEPMGLVYQFARQEPTTATDLVLAYLFALPEYVALYLYAYRSPAVWGELGS